MATILHKDITDADRHEVKGASTAAAGTALFFNGDGTTTPRKIHYSDLDTGPTVGGYKSLINQSSSAATQVPGASNTALQISFGSGASTPDVVLSAGGSVTFVTAGDYAVRYGLSVGAPGTGGSVLFFRVLINGIALEPVHRAAPATSEVYEFSETLFYTASAGDVLTVELTSDSTGSAIGGLYQKSPSTSGWSASPTAEINVLKFKGI